MIFQENLNTITFAKQSQTELEIDKIKLETLKNNNTDRVDRGVITNGDGTSLTNVINFRKRLEELKKMKIARSNEDNGELAHDQDRIQFLKEFVYLKS